MWLQEVSGSDRRLDRGSDSGQEPVLYQKGSQMDSVHGGWNEKLG